MFLVERLREVDLLVASILLTLAIVAGVRIWRAQIRHGSGGLGQSRSPLRAAKKPMVTKVRSTDNVRLEPEQEARRKAAMELISQHRIAEGARILEEIGLHRYAIGALESAGMIDAACDILLRLDRPARAGVLYLRNGQPERAAQLFLRAQLPLDAAAAFSKAAQQNGDVHFYLKAAELFAAEGEREHAMQHFLHAGDSRRFIELALKSADWKAIARALAADAVTPVILSRLSGLELNNVVEAIEVDEVWCDRMAHLSVTCGRPDLVLASLARLESQPHLLARFWSAASEGGGAQFAAILLEEARRLHATDATAAEQKLRRNACATYAAGRNRIAARLFEACGRLALAAKCAASAGELPRAVSLLEECGEVEFAKRLRDAIEKELNRPLQKNDGEREWSPSLLESAARLLAPIDPDNDALHSVSPFSLAS